MKIFYPEKPERSHFLEECENEINQNKESLIEGTPIKIEFTIGGYEAEVRVRINKNQYSVDGKFIG